MKPTFAPIVVAFTGGVLAILLAAAITGPVFWAVDSGGSAWLLLLLFLPMGVAALGLVAAVRLDYLLNRSEIPAPPPLKQDGVDAAFAEIRGALNTLAEQTVVPRQFIPKQRNDSELS